MLLPFPRAALAALSLLGAQCSGSDDVGRDAPPAAGGASGAGSSAAAGSGGFAVTGAASFAELKALFAARCTGCHRGTSTSLVDLRDDPALYERLTTPLATPSCNGRILVVAGSVEQSLLPAKVQPRPPCGNRMPNECSIQGCLSVAEIQTIVNYVGSGAPEQ